MKITYYLTFLASSLLTALGIFYLFFASRTNDYWIWLFLGAAFNGFLSWRSYQQIKNNNHS